jgi:hypothetical protein
VRRLERILDAEPELVKGPAALLHKKSKNLKTLKTTPTKKKKKKRRKKKPATYRNPSLLLLPQNLARPHRYNMIPILKLPRIILEERQQKLPDALPVRPEPERRPHDAHVPAKVHVEPLNDPRGRGGHVDVAHGLETGEYGGITDLEEVEDEEDVAVTAFFAFFHTFPHKQKKKEGKKKGIRVNTFLALFFLVGGGPWRGNEPGERALVRVVNVPSLRPPLHRDDHLPEPRVQVRVHPDQRGVVHRQLVVEPQITRNVPVGFCPFPQYFLFVFFFFFG